MNVAAKVGVSVRALEVGYRAGDVPVVAGLDLEVASGEFHAILGPSGCGKTTLLKALAGLLRASGGTIRGIDRREVGWVPQGNSCFPWLTVEQNVGYGLWTRGKAKGERRDRALELLGRMGLGDQMRAYPATLSEGMRQRVAIARAFATGPSLLLMDEPFSALDYQTKGRLQEQLLELWRELGSTVLYVTHDIDEALLLADRISVLTTRPARVRETVAAPFERPRTQAAIRRHASYGALYERCQALLEPGHAGTG